MNLVDINRELSSDEIIRGKLLSEDNIRLISQEVLRLTHTLCTLSFADPETGLVTESSKTTAMCIYLEAQAKRSALMTLLEASAETVAALAADS